MFLRISVVGRCPPNGRAETLHRQYGRAEPRLRSGRAEILHRRPCRAVLRFRVRAVLPRRRGSVRRGLHGTWAGRAGRWVTRGRAGADRPAGCAAAGCRAEAPRAECTAAVLAAAECRAEVPRAVPAAALDPTAEDMAAGDAIDPSGLFSRNSVIVTQQISSYCEHFYHKLSQEVFRVHFTRLDFRFR